MRVVHLISNLELGGAERTLVRLVGSLADKGVRQTVVSMISGGQLAPDVKQAGADLIELDGRRSFAAARLLPDLGRALRRLQPDVIQGWMYHANLAASVAGIFGYHKAPVFWGIRQSLTRLSDNQPTTAAVILAGTMMRSRPAAIIYNSRTAAAEHERWGYPSAARQIIFNGIDTKVFSPRPKARSELCDKLGIGGGTVLIGRVARNDPVKDNPTLFAAFSLLASKFPEAHLVLVGSGMDGNTKSLQQLAVASGVSERIHFLGAHQQPEKLVQAFDLAISSSSAEGFPNVVAEAMSCGVPAVATDVGETAHIINDSTRVVLPGSPGELAHAMERLLRLPIAQRQRIGAADRQRVLSEFSLKRMADRHLDVWCEQSAFDRPPSVGVEEAL